MLQDALESTDLDEEVRDKTNYEAHPIIKHFITLSECAICRAAYKYGKYLDSGLLEFGMELQWRIAVFRMGEKKASTEYPRHRSAHIGRTVLFV